MLCPAESSPGRPSEFLLALLALSPSLDQKLAPEGARFSTPASLTCPMSLTPAGVAPLRWLPDPRHGPPDSR